MLTDADRAHLAELGIAEHELRRQLELFANPPRAIVLDRPCTVGDGIVALDEAARRHAIEAYEAAAAAGRLQRFVPASGAATRMFQSLLAVRQAGGELTRSALEKRAVDDADSREVLTLLDKRACFPFHAALAAVLSKRGVDLDQAARRGPVEAILAGILDPDGLDYAAQPKALLPFHSYPDGSRTAFEEHLLEGAGYARSQDGAARLHFTVSPEHDAAARALLGAVRGRCEARTRSRLDVGFSHQKPATDTIAVDLQNRPLRGDDGKLVLRPGGHGALIENLNDLRGDVVFLKTIDNIQPEHLRAATDEWLRVLTGHLVALQDAVRGHVAALSHGASADRLSQAQRFAADQLGIEAATDRDALVKALDRPLRVCGMVRNTGEPGGGPFWVRAADGQVSRQIVESAQVDMKNEQQKKVFGASTHFNPVFIACAVRDAAGTPFDLGRFVDPSAVFIARKSKGGTDIKALERPGLWNGAMAYWHTVFVELPDATFSPVKTINDLLRPAHQPPDASPVR